MAPYILLCKMKRRNKKGRFSYLSRGL